MNERLEPMSIAWRHKKLIAVTGILGIAIGVAIAWYLPATYQSKAQILVVKKRSSAVAGFDSSSAATDEYVAPAQDLLKSPLILDRAIRERDLQNLPTFAGKDGPIVGNVAQSLSVTPVKSPAGVPNIFKLSFSSRRAEDCPIVLSAVLESFKDFIDKKYQSVSTDTIELLVREKDTLHKDLAGKEAAYRKFRSEHPFVGTSGPGAIAQLERLNGFQAKISSMMLRRLEFEGQLAALESARKDGRGRDVLLAMLVEFSTGSDMMDRSGDKQLALQERLFPLMLEEGKLLEQYGPRHPEVEGLRRRIEAAQKLLLLPPVAWKSASEDSQSANGPGVKSIAADPIDLHIHLLRQKCAHLRASEQALAKVLKVEQDAVVQFSAFEIEDESHRTGIAFSKQMHETLVKRLGEASLVRNAGGYEVEALESPTSARKVGPGTHLFGAVGGLLGIFLGLGFAYRRQLSNETLKQSPGLEMVPTSCTASIVRLNQGQGHERRPVQPTAELASTGQSAP